MMRGALQGELAPGPFLLTVTWMVGLTILLLSFAIWLFHQEDVLVGSASGSLLGYLRRRIGAPRPARRAALAVAATGTGGSSSRGGPAA
jgi:hypothetical protein